MLGLKSGGGGKEDKGNMDLPVITTDELLLTAMRFGHQNVGMVSADIEEASQDAIFSTTNNIGLIQDLACEELSLVLHLISPPHIQPVARKYGILLQLEDLRGGVP